MSHKEDRAGRAQQTEHSIYAETAITAFETTLRGFDQCLTVQIQRDRECCNRRARLCLKMVFGMPSSALGSRGIEELREALGAPGPDTLLARHNFQCAAAVVATRMPFVTFEVTMMILSCEGWTMQLQP